MDKIEKALKKLSGKDRQQFAQLLNLIKQGKLDNLDVKKLVGHKDIYRVRKGQWRVLFRVDERTNQTFILALERRSDRTYTNY